MSNVVWGGGGASCGIISHKSSSSRPAGGSDKAAIPKNYKPTQNNQDAAFKVFLAFLTFNYPPGASDLDSALTIIEDMVFIDVFHEFTYFVIFEHKTS